MVRLRPMRAADLPRVGRWLAEPHVATWFLAGSSLDEELEGVRQILVGDHDAEMLIVTERHQPIGWCQWYLCTTDPAWAREVGAGPGDVGIDYAIGNATRIGLGLGTQLVAALVEVVRSVHPRCEILSAPDARNVMSRRVLEKNGFTLQRVAALRSEPTDAPMAIYRQSHSRDSMNTMSVRA